jgi:hypothetical protein
MLMGENSARIVVGRLLEVRLAAGYRNAAEVDALWDLIGRELAKLPPGQRHVTVADWRPCPVMAPEAAKRIAERMALNNARTERASALARQDAPVAVMQFLRVIRDANFPNRKLFFEVDEMTSWVGEVLTPDERQRMHDFLKEGA